MGSVKIGRKHGLQEVGHSAQEVRASPANNDPLAAYNGIICGRGSPATAGRRTSRVVVTK